MKWLIVLDFLDNIRVLECPAKLVWHLSRHSIGISFIFSIPSPYHSWLTPLSSMLTDMLTHICLSHCLLIDYKAPIILLPIPSFWLISAYHSLLIDLLTDHPPCLLISLLIPYSYMLIPLLTDWLQSPYCSLTNPPFFYKYCLLPPCVYKLLLAVCQCKQSVPCFKSVLKMSLSLYCALSVCFCQPLSSLWVL